MSKNINAVKLLLVWGLSCMVTISAWGADWPQFQGPQRDGIAEDSNLLKSWPETGPRLLWSVEVGAGFGGVVVKEKRVYLLDRITGQKDVLRCLALETGKELWSFSYDARGRISYPGSRSHPSIDEKYVFIMSPFGELRCVSLKTQQQVWMKNILKEYGGKKPNWAITQSPALYKNKVIVAPLGQKAGIVAFDKDSGKELWASAPIPGKMSYASVMIANLTGVDQALIVTTTHTAAAQAETGEILWQNGDWSCRIPIASPFAISPDRVFVTGGYGSGVIMFRIENNNGKFTATTLFKTKECNGQIHQPILYRDHLYLNCNDKSFRDGLMCMDLAGNVKWKTGKSPGYEWGGILLADDMLYAVDGTKGDLCLIKPDPSGYKEIARAHLLDPKQAWGTIALADGKLLLRDQKQLKCVDVKGSE